MMTLKDSFYLCAGIASILTFNLGHAQESLIRDPMFGYVYRQSVYQNIDHQGDLALCKSLVHTGVTTIGKLARFTIPEGGLKDRMYKQAVHKYPSFEETEDLSNPYDHSSHKEAKALDKIRSAKIQSCASKDPSKVAPLSVKPFLGMIEAVLLEESNSIKFKRGKVHRWSPGFTMKEAVGCPLVTLGPKLLAMLSTGVSYRYAITGKEDLLANEIEKASVRSLYPHDVLRLSYRLNDGDVYLTLLTIENLFSRHWTAEKREAKMVTTRLAHITNDVNADNFGTWYHLFGVMLLGYSHGSFISWQAGFVEGLGSGIASGFKNESQENSINLLGARIGGSLRRMVKKASFFQTAKEGSLNPKNYLNLLELNCSHQ